MYGLLDACACRLPAEREGLRIARRMRRQVPPPPEPKWKRKGIVAKQAAMAEWKPERNRNRRPPSRGGSRSRRGLAADVWLERSDDFLPPLASACERDRNVHDD